MVMILIQVGPGDGYRLSVKGFRNDLSTLYPQLLTAWVTIDWMMGCYSPRGKWHLSI